MKKVLVALLMVMMISGCSSSQDVQTLFVENSQGKYAMCTYGGDVKT